MTCNRIIQIKIIKGNSKRLNHRKCVLKRNALFIENVQGFADVICSLDAS
jgi:hypothetical protein